MRSYSILAPMKTRAALYHLPKTITFLGLLLSLLYLHDDVFLKSSKDFVETSLLLPKAGKLFLF
jgi:hypothetical protein